MKFEKKITIHMEKVGKVQKVQKCKEVNTKVETK